MAGEIETDRDGPPAGEDIPLEIRFEDERVLVVSKPAGLVAHPARGHGTGTLVNALIGRGGPLSGMGGPRPGIVHRLDKDTSGLLLVAKDDIAHQHLSDALKTRAIERRYLALVRGIPGSRTGTIDAPLGRHPQRRRAMAVLAGGRPALTHYSVVASGGGATLLDVRLETGRTHQIRVHLAYLRHPVLGDAAYGGRGELSEGIGLRRPFLHAFRLRFPHPGDGREVEVSDPLPADLEDALAHAGVPLPAPYRAH